MASELISKRLEQLELDIELGLQSVGKALLEIHDKKEYKQNYDTFEQYCKERWGYSDRHARNLIDAQKVREKIGTLVPVSGLKDKHLLAISKIPEKKQAQIAATVIAECEAENRQPTEKDFKDAAKPFVKPKQEETEQVVEQVFQDVELQPEEVVNHTTVSDPAELRAKKAIPDLLDKLVFYLGNIGANRRFDKSIEAIREFAK